MDNATSEEEDDTACNICGTLRKTYRKRLLCDIFVMITYVPNGHRFRFIVPNVQPYVQRYASVYVNIIHMEVVSFVVKSKNTIRVDIFSLPPDLHTFL